MAARKKGQWIKSKKRVFTPGGDPLWQCSNCGQGEHVYGVGTADNFLRKCPDCKSMNEYPWEVNEIGKE